MKECKDCEYFGGYYCDDGTPFCNYVEGYAGCPYCYVPVHEEDKNFCKINMEEAYRFISHSILNCIEGKIDEFIDREISNMIAKKYKEAIQEKTESAIADMVERQVEEYMQGDITVSGGWSEPDRTLSRTQYLGETVQKELDRVLKDKSAITNKAENVARNEIEKFSRSLRDDINNNVREMFDSATRQVLTDNVVSMLMCNDTYQKISENMQKLLP